MILMAAMMVATLTASAQREAGSLTLQPKLGFGLTNITNLEGPNLAISNTKIDKVLHVGGLIGLELEYQLTPMFSVAGGVNYSIQGASLEDTKISVGGNWAEMKNIDTELQYVNVPIVANCYLFPGFALKAGVQFGFLTSAKEKYEFDHNIPTAAAAAAGLPDKGKHETQDFKSNCKKFDFSIPFGASYEFSNVVIDARYHLGLTKINKEGNESYKNSVFMLTFGYKFDI